MCELLYNHCFIKLVYCFLPALQLVVLQPTRVEPEVSVFPSVIRLLKVTAAHQDQYYICRTF